MPTEVTLDTNILFYAFDARELTKHLVSKRLLSEAVLRRIPIPLQCIGEFYNAATRKLPTPADDIERLVRELMRSLPTIPTNTTDLLAGIQIHRQHGLQFFDSVLIATAAHSGFTVLLSEDMQHQSTIAGVTIVNPFLLNSTDIGALIARMNV